MESIEKLFDPLGVFSSLSKVQESWLRNSKDYADMLEKLRSDLQRVGVEELIPFLYESTLYKKSPDDPQAAFLDLVRGYSKLSHKVYAAFSTWIKDYVSEVEGIEDEAKARSVFWAKQFLSCLSPSNCFWTNPAVVQKFIRSRGESLFNGFKNWLEDMERGDNLIKMADTDAFKVGDNLAATPGFVMFRNDLMEIIQYAPRTDRTFSVPIVFIPPWINKYYIADLSEDKSIVRYLLDHGFTVFMISWRNPTAEMRSLTFEQYMLGGALKAVDVAKEVCSARHVHAIDFCIGGALLAALMGWLNKAPIRKSLLPVQHWTLFATLVDYSDPGELGAFVSENAIDEAERLMGKDGYLDGKYMAAVFRLLRPDNLIWRYFVHNYLQGELPPRSDFLYWNSDSTRLPAAMASFYLREFYLKNNLAKKNGIALQGRSIDLGRISQPLYAVGAEQDHICPWKGTFRICNLVQGPVRYVLAEEGHIAGIVNPPSTRSRKSYWSGDVKRETPAEEWISSCRKQQGSWWDDWVEWLSGQCGSLGEPPPIGGPKYQPIEKAPGSYVMEQ